MSPEASYVLEILEELASDMMIRSDAEDCGGRMLDAFTALTRVESGLKRLCRALGADEIADRLERHGREELDRLLGHGWRERGRGSTSESLDREQEAVTP